MEKKKAILLQQSAETVVSWLIIKEHQVCHSICGANVSEAPPHRPLLSLTLVNNKINAICKGFCATEPHSPAHCKRPHEQKKPPGNNPNGRKKMKNKSKAGSNE